MERPRVVNSMKLAQNISRLILPAILAAAPLTLTAQTTNAPGPARPQRAPGIMQGPNGGFALGALFSVMTEPQRASYEAAINNERGQMAGLQAQLRAAGQDFLAASLDQKFDENVLRQKALAASRFEAELAVLRAKAMSKIQPPLTPEQIEKIKGAPAGQVQPFRRPPLERALQRPSTGSTNQDANGLPPKK